MVAIKRETGMVPWIKPHEAGKIEAAYFWIILISDPKKVFLAKRGDVNAPPGEPRDAEEEEWGFWVDEEDSDDGHWLPDEKILWCSAVQFPRPPSPRHN